MSNKRKSQILFIASEAMRSGMEDHFLEEKKKGTYQCLEMRSRCWYSLGDVST